MDQDEIGRIIVNSAYHLHRSLGPGLLESAYKRIFARDLQNEGLNVQVEKWCSFEYKGMWFPNAFRVDLIVENAIIIELKAVKTLDPVFHRQLLTYLKLTNMRLGYRINFGGWTMKDNIRRIAN